MTRKGASWILSVLVGCVALLAQRAESAGLLGEAFQAQLVECGRLDDWRLIGQLYAPKPGTPSEGYVLEPFNLHLSVTGQDTGQLFVYDGDGHRVTEGLSFFGYDTSLISISETGLVTALRTETSTEIGAWVSAAVDGIHASNTSIVRVLGVDVTFPFRSYEGDASILYSPTVIDGENIDAYVQKYQLPLVNDYAY